LVKKFRALLELGAELFIGEKIYIDEAEYRGEVFGEMSVGWGLDRSLPLYFALYKWSLPRQRPFSVTNSNLAFVLN
jgi:hypothetical protein